MRKLNHYYNLELGSQMEAEGCHAFCASYENVKRIENQSNEQELMLEYRF